jgi:IclR family acetate operon transcriptional repressor
MLHGFMPDPQTRASREEARKRETPPTTIFASDARQAPLQTLSRGLRILRFVAASPSLVRLRDVAHAFRLERSVALRLLQTLEAEGFLKKHAPLKAYSLGPALVDLHQPKSLLEQLTEYSRPYLAELTEATGLTSHVGALEDGRVSLVEVKMAPGPIAVRQMPGDFEHFYCSAIGKAIYAYLPDAERSKLVEGIVFHRHKPATLDSVDALERESEVIRQQGVAFDRDEGPAPLACIAAPITDASGLPIASIGVSAIAALVPGAIDQQRRWIDSVREAAAKLSRSLG